VSERGDPADGRAPAPPPKLPPQQLAIRTRPRPVVRMSRKMIAILAGVAGIGLAATAIWSLQGGSRIGGAREELYNVDRIARAEGLARLPPDYGAAQGVPQLGAPLPGDLGRPILSAQEDGRLDPGVSPVPGDPEAEARRARAEQLRREREAVLRSDVFFEDGGARGPAAAGVPTQTAALPADPPATPPSAPAEGSQAAKRAFIAAEPDRRIYGSAELQAPRSPYQLMAGSVIPAALVTGVSSDLPGQAIASVTANVYDSVTGRHLLVPQGARLIGRYDSAVGYGQSRLLLVWERLIFPDGRSILLDNLPGTDPAGQAGLRDRVDHHLDRLIGGAALASLLGVGAELAQPDRGSGQGQVIVAARDSAQESVTEVGQQITRRNLDVQPTLTIRPGFALRVLVQRDLVLPPFRTN
jgi:type IV secretion system protein TrbI